MDANPAANVNTGSTPDDSLAEAFSDLGIQHSTRPPRPESFRLDDTYVVNSTLDYLPDEVKLNEERGDHMIYLVNKGEPDMRKSTQPWESIYKPSSDFGINYRYDLVHGIYRGSDRPVFQAPDPADKTKMKAFKCGQPRKAVIVFPRTDGSATSYGWINPDDIAGDNKRKADDQPSTQPSKKAATPAPEPEQPRSKSAAKRDKKKAKNDGKAKNGGKAKIQEEPVKAESSATAATRPTASVWDDVEEGEITAEDVAAMRKDVLSEKKAVESGSMDVDEPSFPEAKDRSGFKALDVVIASLLDTQMPGFEIKFKLSNGDRVSCYIFASDLKMVKNARHEDDIALKFFAHVLDKDFSEQYNKNHIAQVIPADNDNLKQLNANKSLLMTVIGRTRIQWRGVSTADRAAMRRNRNKADPADSLILALEAQSEFMVFQRAPYYQLSGPWHEYCNFMAAACHLTKTIGTFWYYRLWYLRYLLDKSKKDNAPLKPEAAKEAINNALAAQDFPFKLPPPRWMVTKWKVNEVHTPVPIAASTFSKRVMFPSAAEFVFWVILNLERRRQVAVNDAEALRKAYGDGCTHTVEINPVKFDETRFIVEVKAAETFERVRGETKATIALGAKASVSVIIENEPFDFSGYVQDNVDSAADFTLFARAKNYSEVTRRLSKTALNTSYPATIEFAEDSPLSLVRQIQVWRKLGSTFKRNFGVDQHSVLTGQESRIHRDRQSFFDVNPVLITQWENALKSYSKWEQFNEEQKTAAEQPLDSSTGVTLCLGPPGTGKSTVNVALVRAAVACGKRLLIVAPSNQAVDTLADKIREDIGTAVEMVRFRNVFTKPPEAQTEQDGSHRLVDRTAPGFNADEYAWYALAESETQTTSLHHADIGYARRRTNYIDRLANKGDPQALRCLEIQQGLKANQYMGDNKSERISELENLRREFDAAYLGKEARIVFVTANSSVHELLASFFKPDFMVIEEAGLGSIADLGTPLIAFQESVEYIALAGDHHQGKPHATTTAINEAAPIEEISLLQRLAEDPWQQFPPVVLRTQYRMPSAIMNFLQYFYREYAEGEAHWLRCPPSVDIETPLDQGFFTAHSKLQPLGYDKFRMIGFSVPYGTAERYPDSTTWFNKSEAEAVVDYLRVVLAEYYQLWNNGHDTSQARIQPRDVAIISPYTGQRRWIHRRLAQKGCEKDIACLDSIPNVRGQEFKIVIISLVMNKPRDSKAGDMAIGWIKEKSQINVEFSRSQRFVVAFGNWEGWFVSKESPGSLQYNLLNRRSFAAFKHLVDWFWDNSYVFDWNNAQKAWDNKPDVRTTLFNRLIEAKPKFPKATKAGPAKAPKGKIVGPYDRYTESIEDPLLMEYEE